MDFFEVVQKRRSVRRFTDKKVPPEVIRKALDAALIAPNSSNMQPWEFFWVRNPKKKKQLAEACLSQPAATTAQELIVVVARLDTWRRNQKLMIAKLQENPKTPKSTVDYYKTVVPVGYTYGFLNTLGLVKWIAMNAIGLFRPMIRGPYFRSDISKTVVKSTALACENLMLSLVAQGYACCPMEGFDEARVKRIINLRGRAEVVMVISCGEAAPQGIYGPQIRHDRDLFVKEIN